jgi:hypothetical protein
MPLVFCIAPSTNHRFSFPLPQGLCLVSLSHLRLDSGCLPSCASTGLRLLPWLMRRRKRPPPPPRSAAVWAFSGGSPQSDSIEGPQRRGSRGRCRSHRHRHPLPSLCPDSTLSLSPTPSPLPLSLLLLRLAVPWPRSRSPRTRRRRVEEERVEREGIHPRARGHRGRGC